jgi:hypothetical protein
MTIRTVFIYLLLCVSNYLSAQFSLGISGGTNLTLNDYSTEAYPRYFKPGVAARGVLVAEYAPLRQWAVRAEWGVQVRSILHPETIEGILVTEHVRRFDLTFMESSLLIKHQPLKHFPAYIMAGATFAKLNNEVRYRLVPELPIPDPYEYDQQKISFARRQWFTDIAVGYRWQISTHWQLATETRCQMGWNNFSRRRSEKGEYVNFCAQATVLRVF